MKPKNVIIVLLLVLFALVLFFSLREKSKSTKEFGVGGRDNASKPSIASAPKKEESPADQKRRELVEKVEAVLNTSINFYGRVEDEKGNAISSATVGYNLLDHFNTSGSNGKKITDQWGNFEISGVRGAVLGVNVSKEGYYQIHNTSNQSFAYGVAPDDYNRQPPKPDKPAVFVLHKKNAAEPLLLLSSRQFEITRTGEPILIDLTATSSSSAKLQVRSTIGAAKEGRFPWRYELNIPGGGLIERDGEFDFSAPESGYANALVEMNAADPAWKSGAEKEYFLKFAGGNYGRVQIRFYPRDDRSMIVLEAFVNPKEGSRNLEFDPAKVAK